MDTPARRCAVCTGATHAVVLETARGSEAETVCVLHGLPVLECDQGHRSFVHPDFPLLLLDHLVEQDEANLPGAELRGLLRHTPHCCKCGARLGDEPARERFRFPVELRDVPGFEVEIEAPAARCAQCGTVQLRSRKALRAHTPAAVAHAFKAAQIAAGR